MLALEGHGLSHVAVDGVGSLRARITVRGPGGHSWANRGRPSAIDEVCRIARALSRQPRGDASTNIGLIQGGTAVNAIAAHAELVIEQRALDETLLARFGRALQVLTVEPPLTLEVEEVGGRPAGRLDRRQPLLATVRGVRDELGLPDELVAASTDANAALAAGIPALCLGCATGGEMHTPDEYIDIGSLATGREQLRSVLRALLWDNPRAMIRRPPAGSPRRADELERAVACVRRERDLTGAVRFVSVELRDPDKAELAAWRAGGAAPPREAALVVLADGRTCEAVVDLGGDSLVSWEHVPGVHAAITGDEYAESEVAVKADRGLPRRARAARSARSRPGDGRHLVGGPVRGAGPPRRPGAGLAAQRPHGRHGYARPIGGLLAIVDLDRMQVVRIDDHGVLPRPEPSTATTATAAGAPTATTSSRSRSRSRRARASRLDGRALAWGAVARAHRLQPARVADAARARLRRRRCGAASGRPPALDRRARDPVRRHESDRRLQERVRHRRVRPRAVTSTRSRSDATASARSATSTPSCTTARAAQTIANAICLHEEDAGILWKHLDWRTGARRSAARGLVISSIATVGNYEYGLYWYLTLDGAIAFEAKLTASCTPPAWRRATRGSPRRWSRPASAPATTSTSSALVSTWTSTASATRSFEVDVGARPARAGESARQRRSTSRDGARERERGAAGETRSPPARWRVAKPSATNRMGRPAAYELVPGENVPPAGRPRTPVRCAARGFIDAPPVGRRRSARDERYPAGEYPNQHARRRRPATLDGGRSLARGHRYRALVRVRLPPRTAPRGLAGHAGRSGAASSCGPVGFFDRNPALDVPPQPGHCHPL